ncbi:MAG TPA: DUF6161 domain-containing protein [Rhizomicrobium sp.]|nr:DUF6161 domain-containing protein [Rhizomicrobium sp.]
MAENEWPKSILFAQDGWQVNFGSDDEIRSWAASEREAWNAVANDGGPFANVINSNANLLAPIGSDTSKATLQSIANSYHPAGGTLGKFISRIPAPQVRCATYSEIEKPGSTSNQPGNDFIQARALAVFYKAIGGTLIGVERASEAAQSIRTAVEDVNRIRESDKEIVERYRGLVAACEADWSNKIEGFEAKVALKAPRTFWNSRSEYHNGLATKDRRQWFWSVLTLVGLIIAVAIINLAFPSPKDVTGEIASTVQRLIIFGSLLAVAVWWLRQKLRDVRSHEHFAEDAAERATMIETYAAMRGAGLQDKDLGPILAALYRPAAGTLGDDHGPVLPSEAIWRTLGDIASRPK